MGERATKLWDVWRESSQQFDYFILGLTGALCAYIGQSLKPERLSSIPFLLELISLALLVSSAIFGFKRLEANIQLLTHSYQKVAWEEELAQLVFKSTGEPMITSRGRILTQDDAKKRANALGEVIGELETREEQIAEKSRRFYWWRNLALLAGFSVLVASRILRGYL